MKNEERNGFFIPKEILNLKNVDGNDLIILSEIFNLIKLDNGCYASNNHFSNLLNNYFTPSTISKRIKKLEDLKYIKVKYVIKNKITVRIITKGPLFENKLHNHRDNSSIEYNQPPIDVGQPPIDVGQPPIDVGQPNKTNNKTDNNTNNINNENFEKNTSMHASIENLYFENLESSNIKEKNISIYRMLEEIKNNADYCLNENLIKNINDFKHKSEAQDKLNLLLLISKDIVNVDGIPTENIDAIKKHIDILDDISFNEYVPAKTDIIKL